MQLAARSGEPDQKMSPILSAALIDSLFEAPGTVLTGIIFSAMAATMTALKMGQDLIWIFVPLLIVAGAVRAFDLRRYQARKSTLTAEEAAQWQQRYQIGAMIQAVLAVQPSLDKFYDLMDDEQEARLNASAEDRRKMSAANGATEAPAQGPVQGCGPAQSAALQWPADEIEAKLHPNDTQRAALKGLRDANARAVDILSAGCQPTDATTPPARLDAIDGRLEAMLQAVSLVSAALQEFYATLSDGQKAQFEAIGQKRTA